LSAFDRIADGTGYTLGIIGEGPMRDELEQQAAELTNSNQVTFLGFLEDEDALLGYMHASTVFASPSTREGFGISLLEAMAADCTVIGVRHPNSAAAEVIGDAGVVCRPTVGGVAEALRTALDGYQPPVRPSERAREFDWDKITTQSLDLYNRVLDNRDTETSLMSGHVTQH
jgi:glycosyltransferase involved in cell wall biosynthesis